MSLHGCGCAKYEDRRGSSHSEYCSVLGLKTGVWNFCWFGVFAEISFELVILDHQHGHDWGVDSAAGALQDSEGLDPLLLQGHLKPFIWDTGVPMNFSDLPCISSKNSELVDLYR